MNNHPVTLSEPSRRSGLPRPRWACLDILVLLFAVVTGVSSISAGATVLSSVDSLSFSTTGQGLYGADTGTMTLPFSTTLVNVHNISGQQSTLKTTPNLAHAIWQATYNSAYAVAYTAEYSLAYAGCHPLVNGADYCAGQAVNAASAYGTTQAIRLSGTPPAQTLTSGVQIAVSNASLNFGLNGQIAVSAVGALDASYATQTTLSVSDSSVAAGHSFMVSLQQMPQSLALSSIPSTVTASIGDSFSTSGTMSAAAYLNNLGESVTPIDIPNTLAKQQTLLSASIDSHQAQLAMPIANYTTTADIPSIQNKQISLRIPIPETGIKLTVPVVSVGIQLPTLQSNQTISGNDFLNPVNPTISSSVGPEPGGTSCVATLSVPCPMQPTDIASVGLNVPFLADLIATDAGLSAFDPLGPGGVGISIGVPDTPITIVKAELDYLTYYTEAVFGLGQQLSWTPGLVTTLQFSHSLLVKLGDGPFVLEQSAQISPDETITLKDPIGGPLKITPIYSLDNNVFTNTTSLYARFQQDINLGGYTASGIEAKAAGIPEQWYAYSKTFNTGDPINLYSAGSHYSLAGFEQQTGNPLQIDVLTAVPAPAGMGLMFFGALGLIALFRKKSRSKRR